MIEKLLDEPYWKELPVHQERFKKYMLIGVTEGSDFFPHHISKEFALSMFSNYLLMVKLEGYPHFENRIKSYFAGMNALSQECLNLLFNYWKSNLGQLKEEVLYYYRDKDLNKNHNVEEIFQEVIVRRNQLSTLA